jgi:hypothetical protein
VIRSQLNPTNPSFALAARAPLACTNRRFLARGAKLNRLTSHARSIPAARPNATAVSTYGAATTVRPSASAGRICQRSRNARSAA